MSKLSKAQGLGSNKHASTLWFWQRVSAVFLLILTVFLIVLFVCTSSWEYFEVVSTLQNPWISGLLMVFLVVGYYHLTLGLQVIIEDYVGDCYCRVFLLILTYFVTVLLLFVSLSSMFIIL